MYGHGPIDGAVELPPSHLSLSLKIARCFGDDYRQRAVMSRYPDSVLSVFKSIDNDAVWQPTDALRPSKTTPSTQITHLSSIQEKPRSAFSSPKR